MMCTRKCSASRKGQRANSLEKRHALFEAMADIFGVIMRAWRAASLLMGNTAVCLFYVTNVSEQRRSWGAALFCTTKRRSIFLTTFLCEKAAVETRKHLQTALKQGGKQTYSHLFCACHASEFMTIY